MIDDEHLDNIRRALIHIFEICYGNNKSVQKTLDVMFSDMDAIVRNLTDNEKDTLPGELRKIRGFLATRERFRQFFRKNTKAEERGELDKIYSRLQHQNDRYCVAIYVSHPKTIKKWGYPIAKEMVGLSKIDNELPRLVASYLNEPIRHEGESGHLLDNDVSFYGEQTTPVKKYFLTFDILEKIDARLFVAKLSRSIATQGKEIRPKIIKDIFRKKPAERVYAGHLMTMQNGSFLFFGDRSVGGKKYFKCIAQATDNGEKAVLDAIVLLESGKPMPFNISGEPDPHVAFREKYANKLNENYWAKQLLLFK